VVLDDGQTALTYAGEDGMLEFRSETDGGKSFSVGFTPSNPCDPATVESKPVSVGKDKNTHKDIMIESATCHIRKDAAADKYTFTINFLDHAAQASQASSMPVQPAVQHQRLTDADTKPVGTFYVKPCPPGCTHSAKIPKKAPKPNNPKP
jgi:hypothetical protein